MANLILNSLIGDKEFLDGLEEGGMNYYLPYPFPCDDPASWALDNWGTKWDMYDYRVRVSENCLAFLTANSGIEKFLANFLESEDTHYDYVDMDNGGSASEVGLPPEVFGKLMKEN